MVAYLAEIYSMKRGGRRKKFGRFIHNVSILDDNLKLTNAVRGIAWLEFGRRTWQAAISPGEPHAGFEPGIS